MLPSDPNEALPIRASEEEFGFDASLPPMDRKSVVQEMPPEVEKASAPATSVTQTTQAEPPATVTRPLQEAEPPPPEPPAPNYEIKHADWTSSEISLDPNKEVVILPSATGKVLAEKFDNLPKIQLAKGSQSSRWAEVTGASLLTLPPEEGLVATMADKKADWQQSIGSEVGELLAGQPKVRANSESNYTLAQARLLVRKELNLGTVFTLPLWHSGFWITLRSPSHGDLLELYQRITQDKVSLGRSTYGLLFSSTQVYTRKHLLDFIIEHAYETSANVKDIESIRPLIKMADLSLLEWGLACSTYPSGFQYRRACACDPEKCHHIVEAKLNLQRLHWTNRTKLTDLQIKHMTKRQRGSTSLESIGLYETQFNNGQPRLVTLTPNLKVELKMPSAVDFIESGTRWADNIEETYGRAVTFTETTRDSYLADQARATMLRQYGHCVSSVHYGDAVFSDRTSIEDLLNDIGEDDKARTTFCSEIAKYLDDSIMSTIAIPGYKCPSCKGEQPTAMDDGRKGLIPLDVAQTFFDLLVQRLGKIQNFPLLT